MANSTGRKFGGRTKGTPNKFTKELRDKVNTFIESNYKQFEEDFKELDKRDRVNVYMKLLDMSLPKEITIESEEEDFKTVTFDVITIKAN